MRLLLGRLAVICGMVVSATSPTLIAQEKSARPRLTAPQLFPESTLAYVRVADVEDLQSRLDDSTMGKMMSDKEIAPILKEFYGSLVKNTAEIQEAIGLDLDELLSIPRGELAVALLPPKRVSSRDRDRDGEESAPRSNQPAVVAVLDAGEEIASVEVLLQRIEKEVGDNSDYDKKEIDELTLHSFTNRNRRAQQFAYFIDGGTLVASSSLGYLEQMAEDWQAGETAEESLADNRKFVSIMSRCVGTEGERPQVTFFVDPIRIVRELLPKNAGTMFALSLLGPLGIDGIEAAGGSWIVSPPDFDSISHMHLLLESPKTGVLKAIRPKTGQTAPEPWVPRSVGSYATINWDMESTLDGVEQLFDKIRGDGALENTVFQPVLERFDIDIREDVIGNLEGRITMVQGFVRPVTINSGSNVYAFKLKDPKAFKARVLDKVEAMIEDRTSLTDRNVASELIVKVLRLGRDRGPNSPIRTPEICFGIYKDYLLIADSQYMIDQVGSCIAGTTEPLLDMVEYQLISERISAQLQEKDCSALSFARPEETLQLFYELARDPANMERLRQISDNNGVFKALLSALEKHTLPPFSVIAKYLAPSGGFLVEEETGMHYTAFGLK